MKRLWLFFALLLALPAFGQYSSSGILTAQAASCAPSANTTACIFLPIDLKWGTVGVSIAGTFSATLQFEGSADNGATWASVNATPAGGTTAVTSTTGTGTWTIPSAGFSHIRVRCSTYSSGSATATLNPSIAVTAGSGGGGTITGVTAGTGLSGGGSSGGVTLNFASGNIGVTKSFLTATMANTFSAAYAAQTLTGLSFSVAANTNYVISCSFQYVVSGTNTGTPNWTVTGPASPTQVSVNVFQTGAAATAVVQAQQTAAAFPTQIGAVNVTTVTSQDQASMVIMLQNGANAGTVQIQAGAQGIGTVTFTAGQSACVMN